MKKIEKIKDFIKAFFYYPKMKRYFRKRKMIEYDIWKSAIKYAWWHCHYGKLKSNDGYLFVDDLIEPLKMGFKNQGWKSVYYGQLIIKGSKAYRVGGTIKIKGE